MIERQLFMMYLDIIQSFSNNSEENSSETLEKICNLTDSSAISFYKFKENFTVMENLFYWCNPNDQKKYRSIQVDATFQYPWLIRKIKENEAIVISSLNDLPSEAFFEIDLMTRIGIDSFVVIPIFINDNDYPEGYIRIDNFKDQDSIVPYLDSIKKLGNLFFISLDHRERYGALNDKVLDQQLLLDNTEIHIWYLKNSTTYGLVNRAHAMFFGKKKDEMSNKDVYDVLDAGLADDLVADYLKIYSTRTKVEKEKWFTDINGVERLFLLKIVPILDIMDEVSYIICSAEDITDMYEVQQKLIEEKENAERANSLKSRFLANMSHEIRTPMNAIVGFLNLLKKTHLDEDQNDYIDKTLSATDSLLYIINDILDLSKIEANMFMLDFCPFDLLKTVEETASSWASKAEEKGIELYISIEKLKYKKYIGDMVRVRQIINNLISNAIKFTEKGFVLLSEYVISETDTHLSVAFEVKDTGPGISPDDQKTLFKPFTQVDSSLKRKHGGTGLGLAISRDLAKMMGGSIELESEVDKGSTFTFTARFTKPEAEESNDNLLDKFSNINSIVITSDPFIEKITTSYLDDINIKYTSSCNKNEIVDLVRNFSSNNSSDKPTILFVDYPLLGRMKQLEKMLVQENLIKHCKIIVLCYFSEKEIASSEQQSVSYGIVTKPILKNQLSLQVSKSLGIEKKNSSENVVEIKKGELNFNNSNAPKILLAEDNNLNRIIATKILNNAGLKCDVAENGQLAVELYEKNGYDVILMDCQMPIMDGFEATAKIRKSQNPDSPPVIIALTANAMDGDRERCISAGMDEYVTKPINVEELLQKIKNLSRLNDAPPSKAKSDVSAIESFVNETGIPFEDAQQIYKTFNEETLILLDTIEQKLKDENWVDLAKLAHQLKGSSGNLRIMDVSQLAKEFELSAKEHLKDNCENILNTIKEKVKNISS